MCYEKSHIREIQEPSSRRNRTFKGYTKEGINTLINEKMLESILESEETNLVANVLTCHITHAIDTIAPFITIQPRYSNAPYLSANTKIEMGKRDMFKAKAYETYSVEDTKEYKKAKNRTFKANKRGNGPRI